MSSSERFVDAMLLAKCWPDMMVKEEAERALRQPAAGELVPTGSNALTKAWAQLAVYNIVYDGKYGGFKDRECLRDMSNVVWYQISGDRSVLTGPLKVGEQPRRGRN